MIWGHTQVEGWFYVKRYLYYQRCEGRAVSYIQKRLFSGYIVQVYQRGQMHYCDIEKRFTEFESALEYATEMLDQYKDKKQNDMHKDYYSPWNPEGYWETEYHRERLEK